MDFYGLTVKNRQFTLVQYSLIRRNKQWLNDALLVDVRIHDIKIGFFSETTYLTKKWCEQNRSKKLFLIFVGVLLPKILAI